MTICVMNADPDVMRRAASMDPVDQQPRDHDFEWQKHLGGKLMSKDNMLKEMERVYKQRPGFGSRGGNKPEDTASRSYNWWKKRGVITEINS